jgi:hypothetical protein
MSRDLPERPSLDHLRKQAKLLLRELRRRDPQAKLTMAQHAVAREYGFASWRELKSHVQKRSEQPVDVAAARYGFERYTPKARQALFFSRREASEAGSAAIDPEHVLLGSIRAGHGLRGRIVERLQLSLEDVRARIRLGQRNGEALGYSIEIPFSGATKQALLAATSEADRMGHPGIGIAHLFLGLLGPQPSLANSLLADRGVTVQRLRASIADLLDEESGDSRK